MCKTGVIQISTGLCSVNVSWKRQWDWAPLQCSRRFTAFIKIHTQLSNGDSGGFRAPLSFQTNQFSLTVLLPASAVPKCLFGDILHHSSRGTSPSFISLFFSFCEIKLPTVPLSPLFHFSWWFSPNPSPSLSLALFPFLFCISPLSSSEYQYWIFCVILWLVQYFSELFRVMPPLGPASANKILKKVQMKMLVCGLWYTVVCCVCTGFSCGGSWTDILRYWKKTGTAPILVEFLWKVTRGHTDEGRPKREPSQSTGYSWWKSK